VKTHEGMLDEMYWLTKDDPGLAGDLRAFLSRTYELKTVADYEMGPEVQT
jgi:hypothetical protein